MSESRPTDVTIASSTQGEEEAKAAARRERMRELGKRGGKRSGEARRKRAETRQAEGSAPSGRSAMPSVGTSAIPDDPVSTEAVVRELRRKAEAGDVAAARELRGWLDRADASKQDFELADLDRTKRELLRRWLLEGLGEGKDPANEGNREGTIDGFDAPPHAPSPPPRAAGPIAAHPQGPPSATETPPNAASETPPSEDAIEPLPTDGTDDHRENDDVKEQTDGEG